MTFEMMTYDTLVTFLGVKKGTLYAWVSRHEIPHVCLRKRTMRFAKDKIDAWVRARTFVPSALRGQDAPAGHDSPTATPSP
jgi:excisionase family DNA binding protein